MLYGTIMRSRYGFQIRVGEFDTITYMDYTVREAKARHRRQFKLKNKKIRWGGEFIVLCFVNKNIESVSNLLPEMEALEMEFYARVRGETLNRLVAMPSYECKPLKWKNIYYDYWRKKVVAEMEANITMLHITFTDGSNPYIYRGTTRSIKRQLRKWEQNYTITGTYTRFGIYFVTATPKREPIDLFSFAD